MAIPLGLLISAIRLEFGTSLQDVSSLLAISHNHLYDIEEFEKYLDLDKNFDRSQKIIEFFSSVELRDTVFSPELIAYVQKLTNISYLSSIIDYEKYYRSIMPLISPAFLTITPPAKDGYDFTSYGRFFAFFMNTILRKINTDRKQEEYYVQNGINNYFIKLAFEKAWGRFKSKRKSVVKMFNDIQFTATSSKEHIGRITGKVDVARRSLMTQNVYYFAYLLLYLYHTKISILPNSDYSYNYKGYRDSWENIMENYGKEHVFDIKEAPENLPDGDIIELKIGDYTYTVTFQSILYDPDIFYIVKKRDI